MQKMNELDTPINLLAETTENAGLKSSYNEMMQKIYELAPKCDLLAIPKTFYKSAEDFFKSKASVTQIMQKWAQRLRV